MVESGAGRGGGLSAVEFGKNIVNIHDLGNISPGKACDLSDLILRSVGEDRPRVKARALEELTVLAVWNECGLRREGHEKCHQSQLVPFPIPRNLTCIAFVFVNKVS